MKKQENNRIVCAAFARKMMALALSVCMMTTMLPVAAFAEGEILGPEQAPVTVSTPDSTPPEPPEASTPTPPEAPPAPTPPEAPSTPTPPEAPPTPTPPEAPPAPTAPSTPAESNSTDAASSSAASSSAAASGSETLVPESDPSAPADSGVTQQSP
ncbi:MAG: hypothetical protein RR709_06335, partial [Ruthenibacterium sp.]